MKNKSGKRGELLKALVRLRQQVAELKKKEIEYKQTTVMLEESIKEIKKTLWGVVNALTCLVEMREHYTQGHAKNVAKLSCAIARKMGLSKERIDMLQIAASIHDIGKVEVPFEILNRPGRLNHVQFKMIKNHPQTGYKLATSMNFPLQVADIILQHHERLDGSGYPRGLKGDEIMLEARILACADVVEAMSSRRSYRPAHSMDECLEEVWQKKSTLYDPDVADACINLFAEGNFTFSVSIANSY